MKFKDKWVEDEEEKMWWDMDWDKELDKKFIKKLKEIVCKVNWNGIK